MILPIAFLLLQSPATAVSTRQMTVTVTDDKGRPIEGLTAQEVAVTENGVARAVTRLELDRRPLAAAVIVDSSQPQASLYRLQIVPAVTSLLSQLPEGSRFALWTTGDRPTRILDYGSDAAQATRALQRVVPQGGNTLLDALVEASRDLEPREGERAVVVAVTGLGIGFRNYDRQQVVEEALKSGAVFFSAQFEEARVPPGADRAGMGEVEAADYDYVLSRLADRSGGRRETTLSAMGLDSAVRRLVSDLRGQYRLAYEGLPGVKDPKVQVTVARPEVSVRVRPPRT